MNHMYATAIQITPPLVALMPIALTTLHFHLAIIDIIHTNITTIDCVDHHKIMNLTMQTILDLEWVL